MNRNNRQLWIVVSGNPIGGIEFHGPFDSADDANEYAAEELKGEWWLGKLQPFTEAAQQGEI